MAKHMAVHCALGGVEMKDCEGHGDKCNWALQSVMASYVKKEGFCHPSFNKV